MLKIGITGGIGSGKSEICKIIEKLGSKVIYADNLAKDILDTDEEVKKRVKKEFGEDIYLSEGCVDRKKLAKLIFNDETLKSNLENIIHPNVIKHIQNIFKKLEGKHKTQLIFLEAALIYESKVNEILDYVIVVYAPEELCIKRVMNRDNTKSANVLSRLKSQMPPEIKISKADFIIHNDENLLKLETNVKFIHNILNKLAEKSNES
ncbi:MAG: dephospho-CoA kinase [Bacteroidetes bacterium]|nr:dephospho-CoA kinase [Bacteroidota bacterium]MBU2635739.1 dephospho-CoA kinase [Bacteroidota bacterium]